MKRDAASEFLTTVFLLEMERQTDFVLKAFQDLEGALLCKDTRGVWFSVQALLTATGNISMILWPAKDASDRGASLRQALGITDDSILKDRRFRNHFAHFDERLEKYASQKNGIVDANIGIRGVFVTPGAYLRNYDCTTHTLTFLDESYELLPVMSAVKELHERVQDEMMRG